MEWVVIVMMLALVEYIVLSARVGFARGRTGIVAPAVTGNAEFERHFRVHYNTLEQLILFLPGMWFFAAYVHELGAAGVGAVFLVGRALYAIAYVKDPGSRGIGMMLSIIPCYILVLGSLGGAIWSLVS
ncbi:MAG: glutathione S-transferase [Candidatus Azotimanducaceae bacterium]|jgi:glutathione S-transferase